MDKIFLENFRCFGGRQEARLAPLTLLVGENSTGKTSFMAMVRALYDVAFKGRIPNFKQPPYDLGSFDDIAHNPDEGSIASHFRAGFETTLKRDALKGVAFETRFEKEGSAPIPTGWTLSHNSKKVEWKYNGKHSFIFAISDLRKKIPASSLKRFDPTKRTFIDIDDVRHHVRFLSLLSRSEIMTEEKRKKPSPARKTSPSLTDEELRELSNLLTRVALHRESQPFAGAPVRSKPLRTYDPTLPEWDPEGKYIPHLFAEMSFQDKAGWAKLQKALQTFGNKAGLFDEIQVKHYGKQGSDPFQLQVRISGGPWRNLIDVGYGVSQALPVITELFRRDAPSMFLWQQPEVHLHPSAQAALGSLFCEIAAPNKQLIVETHSDHLIDRVRMDVRDKKTKLTPDDVSLLFFERKNQNVQIHSIRFDKAGNVLDAPESYRRFFMEEVERSLNLPHYK